MAGDHSASPEIAPPAEPSLWEGRCRRCGLCCFHKIEEEDGTIFVTAIPCRFLDVVERTCKVYERRFTVNPTCIKLTPELVARLAWLPPTCGYRAKPGDNGE